MTVCVIAVLLCISAALIVAGAVKLERRTARWEKYERFFHPPDDDDGVSVIDTTEGDDNHE